ncbi:hypothetical protein Psi02_15950 [Planotetraspora silvatica]|uniref:Uncharacterized protein n=1 Tax=Planotetraspora silvatica TaxID=234614 RepID=A0A8J3XMF7_9ACTN|nr:hypothetical protein Psi02_15950 [Planotetraspora silvatica]
MLSRRKTVSRLSDIFVMSAPARYTAPTSGRSRPAAQCMNVLFPDPDGPIKAVKVPWGKVMETSRSATTEVGPVPKDLDTL